MDEQEERLNTDLLAALRESAPWAAEQIDESVRQGKPVAKQARRRRGALLHEYPLPVGRRGSHFSGPSAGATLRE